jgi:ketol-acid reductoisomerase
MKKGSLSYSHGFNIVEEGMQIRKDITVIMCAPKCPGSEVREEYKEVLSTYFNRCTSGE